MAPNVKLHFFAANDINGSVLHEITDEDTYFKKLVLKLERDGLGGAELVLARSVNFAGFGSGTFQPEVFVRLIIAAYSDTSYYPWGFFLDKRQQTVVHVEESGAEEFHFGGPGPKQYLTRSALGIEQLTGATYWNLDLENGIWRWGESATAGRILNRIYQEDQARTDPALPDLSLSFDAATDSNGNPWTDDDLGGPDQFELPIGNSFLQCLWDIDDVVELTSSISLGAVDAPQFILNVAEGLGTDVSGSSFGAGVCLLKEGVNIANKALVTEGASLKKASHVIVEGKDGNWVEVERLTFTSGDYVKIAKISYTRQNSDFWLQKAGLRWLQRQDNGEKEHIVEIVPGTSDATGFYFPAPDRNLWLSNIISLDTSADGMTHSPLDIQPSEDQLVTGLLLETHQASDDSTAAAKAFSWDVTVYLNRERPPGIQRQPNQRSAATGGDCECKQMQLCAIHIPGTPPSEIITPVKAFNADGDGGDSLSWTGNLSNQGPPGAAGSTHYYFKSNSPTEYSVLYAVSAGVTLRITGYTRNIGTGEKFKIGFFDGGTLGDPASSSFLIGTATTLAINTPGSTWVAFSVEVVTPVGTIGFALGHDGTVDFDQVSISSVVVDPGEGGQEGVCPEDVGLECASGVMACASRGDHVHAHGNLSDGGTHHHDTTQIEGDISADFIITNPAEGDMLRFNGTAFVNTPGRWEPVTDGVDTFVWDGAEIVMAWVNG